MSGWGILSILLHIVTILFVLYLYYTKPKARFGEDADEVEQLLIKYTNEMKADNDRVIHYVKQKGLIVDNSEPEGKAAFKDVLEEVAAADEFIQNDDDTPLHISKEAQVLQMYKEGSSPGTIARTLGLGHGEVNLMIRLHNG
ncbi:hypothetical protein JCM19037_231 [Geomicrobium sp. JCM 19037]|uniref:DUF6115 domain-containing protein n=1 Tax=Geomicrobium sp. JCM 19037 TaxID=1460634 RepID=UPI00045F1D58|nr:hypothetical protein [Geomicrobium sp. JCM 19037]GAK02031.1 hypothetical protein JCM19037_231 [Geomicrobium sp. JCM 19037]